MADDVVYDEIIERYHCVLTRDGALMVDGKKYDWYMDSHSGKPWFPKRRNFISLVKQMIRDDEFRDDEFED